MLNSLWNKITSAPGAIAGVAKEAVQGVVCDECPTCPGITEQLTDKLWNLMVAAKDLAYNFASEHPYIAIGTVSAGIIGTTIYCTRKPAVDCYPIFEKGYKPPVSSTSRQTLMTDYLNIKRAESAQHQEVYDNDCHKLTEYYKSQKM